MENLNLNEELRKNETSLLVLGVIFFVLAIILWLLFNKAYHGYVYGYSLGVISYIVLIEGIVRLSPKRMKLSILLVFLTNIKLIIIGLAIYFSYKFLQINILHTCGGLFTSQLAITFSLISLYKNYKKDKSLK